jgi:carboxypeptidase C (cathepsin A)
MRVPLSTLLLLGSATVTYAQKSNPDYMESMPNTPPFKSLTYSGYLEVTATKQLHYTFTESLDNPTKDPIILWFNGGPGCSSMMAFLQESGPYVVDDGESYLKENPYPWNLRANVGYVESPAGVGYSMATGKGDMAQNDVQSSEDNYAAIQSFFAKFPQFKSNELYIAGESYAGIYVPYLSWQIWTHNQQIPQAD